LALLALSLFRLLLFINGGVIVISHCAVVCCADLTINENFSARTMLLVEHVMYHVDLACGILEVLAKDQFAR
jgi:hypothetical protein